MKKSYVKPQVFYEDFQLSANIAETCGSATHTYTANTCVWEYGNLVLFMNVCKDNAADFDTSTGKTCYHHPTSEVSLFAS